MNDTQEDNVDDAVMCLPSDGAGRWVYYLPREKIRARHLGLELGNRRQRRAEAAKVRRGESNAPAVRL